MNICREDGSLVVLDRYLVDCLDGDIGLEGRHYAVDDWHAGRVYAGCFGMQSMRPMASCMEDI